MDHNSEKSYVIFKKSQPHCETCHLLGVDKQPYCLSRVSFTDVHKKKGSLASLRYNLGTTYHVSKNFFVLHRIWAFRKKSRVRVGNRVVSRLVTFEHGVLRL